MAELQNLKEKPRAPIKVNFKYNFAHGTCDQLNYTNSPRYMEAIKTLCTFVKIRNNREPYYDVHKAGVKKETRKHYGPP